MMKSLGPAVWWAALVVVGVATVVMITKTLSDSPLTSNAPKLVVSSGPAPPRKLPPLVPHPAPRGNEEVPLTPCLSRVQMGEMRPKDQPICSF
jgi:hypothetical protein